MRKRKRLPLILSPFIASDETHRGAERTRLRQEPSAVASALTTRQSSTLGVAVKSSVCAVTMVMEGNCVCSYSFPGVRFFFSFMDNQRTSAEPSSVLQQQYRSTIIKVLLRNLSATSRISCSGSGGAGTWAEENIIVLCQEREEIKNDGSSSRRYRRFC